MATDYTFPAGCPVVTVGKKLLAMHVVAGKDGSAFAISEVVPVAMSDDGRVARWNPTFGGVRLLFSDPVDCENALTRLLVALRSLQVEPRKEAKLDA